MRQHTPNFLGIYPQTYETFAEITRRRFYHSIQRALHKFRLHQPDMDFGIDIACELASANATLGTLFDMGHPDCGNMSKRLSQVTAICKVSYTR